MTQRYADMYRRSAGNSATVNRDQNRFAQFTYEDVDEGGDCCGAPVPEEVLDRMESLTSKLHTNDDKIINLTKLLKLTQSLHEEREYEMKKEMEEMRHKNRKLEQMNARLANNIDELRGQMNYAIDENRKTNQLVQEVAQRQNMNADVERLESKVINLSHEVVEMRSQSETRLSQVHEDIARQIERWTTTLEGNADNNAARRVTELEDRIESRLAEHSERIFNSVTEVTRTVSDVKSGVETTVRSDIAALDDAIAKLRTDFDKVLADTVNSVEDAFSDRMKEFEERVQALHVSMSEYVHNYRVHVEQNTQKTDEICNSLKQLLEVHDTTRSVLSSDMESLKEWMQKLGQKLKGKLEIVTSEVKLTKEDQMKLMTEMVKQRSAVSQKEKDALIEILSSKSNDATQASKKVEEQLKTSTVAVASGGQARSRSVGALSHPPSSGSGVNLDAFLEQSKARRQQLDEMCSDLATLDKSLSNVTRK
eukprot:PhM_4_TR16768/c0_g1_i1/m.75271